VCAFDALGAVPSGVAATAASVPSSLPSARAHSDLRWRAAFAVQLYSALELPTFRSLEPWLFRTSLRTLQPLVTRFWREDRLQLMEEVLRVVDAQSASTNRVMAALAGWRTRLLDVGLSDAHFQQAIDTFRERLKVGPQLQQTYRQERRQQQQLKDGEVRALIGRASSLGFKQDETSLSSCAAASSIGHDESRPPCEPTPPLLDLFSLSASNSIASPTSQSIAVPLRPLADDTTATATVAVSVSDEQTSERVGALSLASSSAATPSAQHRQLSRKTAFAAHVERCCVRAALHEPHHSGSTLHVPSSSCSCQQQWMELVAMCMNTACCAAVPATSTTRLVLSSAEHANVPSMVSAGGLLCQLLSCCARNCAMAVRRMSSMTCWPIPCSVHTVRWCSHSASGSSRSVDGVADCGRKRAVLAL